MRCWITHDWTHSHNQGKHFRVCHRCKRVEVFVGGDDSGIYMEVNKAKAYLAEVDRKEAEAQQLFKEHHK